MKKTNAVSAGFVATSTLLTTFALTGAQTAEAGVRKPFTSAGEVLRALETMKFRSNTTLLDGFDTAQVEQAARESNLETAWVEADAAPVKSGERSGRTAREYWESEPEFQWEEVEIDFEEAAVVTFDSEFADQVPAPEVEMVVVEETPAAFTAADYEQGFDEASFEAATAEFEGRSSDRWSVQPTRSSGRYRAQTSRRQTANTSTMEKQILEMVNGERVRRGLRPLVWDNNLCRAGRDHSQDMARRNYFSHFSPEGSSVTERAVARGVNFRYLGENLALDYSARSAHNNLMRSQGHRENILKREYRKVGIGVSVSPRGEILVTQVFSG